MKSPPIKVGSRLMHPPGTLIGKAREPLEKGSGKILMPLQLTSKTIESFSVETIPAARSFERRALMRAVILLFTFELLLLVWPTPSRAQSIQYTQNKPDQALRSAMRVDPSTLGLSIEVPIGSYPGRGGASVPINLSYSSKQWRIDFYDSWLSNGGLLRTESHPKFSEWAKAGWTTGADIPIIEWTGHSLVYNGNGNAPCDGCSGSGDYYINRIQVHMPGGASHELRINDTPVTTPTYAGTYYAVDGSNLRYEATSISDGILYLPDGSRYVLGYTTSQYIDRNGNTLSYSETNRQWTDTQGRVLDVPLPDSPAATTYTYYLPSTSSTPVSYSVRWSTLQNALTNPSDTLRYLTNMTFGIGETFYPRSPALFDGDGENRLYDPPGQTGLFNPVVLAEIILPNGQHYLFTYNIWGELTKVVYPTGAYERFDYAAIPGVSFLKAPYPQGNRGVVDRWLSPTGNSGDEVHWHYAASKSNFVLTVSTTEPDNTLNERLMSAETSEQFYAFGFSHVELGMPFEERVFAPTSAGGAMLRRTLTSWTSSGTTSPGWYIATRNPRVIKKVSILLDTGTSNALTSTTTMSYDDDLNVIAKNHYDFTSISQNSAQTSAIGSISAGSLLRTEEATYLVNDTAISSTTRAAYRNRNLLSLPTSTRVKNASGTIVAQTETSYDETGTYPLLTYSGTINGWTDPATNVRGLPTTTGVWLNTTNSYLRAHAQYDQLGNVRNTWDAKGNQPQMTYSSTYSYAYPTNATTVVPDPTGVCGSTTALSTTAEYNVNTGLMTSLTDPNGQTTSYTYDAINRPATITRPSGGGSTSYAYGDSPGNLYVRTQTSIDSTRVVEAYQYYDKLGRPSRTFLNEGSTYSTTDTQYDSMGRSWRISNPYRTTSLTAAVNPDEYWTTNAYDYLGRVTSVTTPDGAVVTSAYSGSTSTPLGPVVTVTDQAGKLKRSLTDALGRLSRVDEPDTSGTGSLGTVNSPQQATSYSYDLLGNLLEVTQGSQTRRFLYDSLSRLRSAMNPESGTVNYTFDDNGNLLTKTDERGVVSNYSYDALNRNTSVTYTSDPANTPTITRTYDLATNGKGRLYQSQTSGASGSLTTIDAYDALGRAPTQRQQFYASGAWGQSYTTQRVYNLAGGVTSQINPSGHTVAYSYDTAGRTTSFSGNLGDGTQRTYSSGIIYSALGGMAKEKFGTDTPLYNKLWYNSRGQLAEMRVSTSYTGAGDTSWNRGAIINHYSNQCWGMCAGQSMTDNDGNLKKQEHQIPDNDQVSTWQAYLQTYGYDSLNRLQSVNETKWVNGNGTQTINQVFDYDRYGNRTINQAQTWGGINNKEFTVNSNNNRLGVPSGQAGAMTYDNAGNLTTDTYSGSGVTRTYDAENRMTSETQANNYLAGSYTYSADGQRVRRKVGNVETWQVYGFDGELLAEYAANAAPTSPQKEYGYRNGKLLITAEPAARTNVAAVTNGGVASASSQESPYVTTFTNDGERLGYLSGQYTFWRDNTQNSWPDWLQIDFNGSKTIDEIDVFTVQDNAETPATPTETMTFSLHGVTAFDVQYWNGSSWITITGGSVTGNNKVWRKFTFTAITTSKIRVTVNAALNSRSRIVELEAYGTPAGPARTNVGLAANGGAATASSQESPYTTSYTNDGERLGYTSGQYSFWRDNTNNTWPDWLQIDFNGSKTIDEIDVFTVQDNAETPSEPTEALTFSLHGITAFDVQYWDGSAWVTVPNGSVTGNNKVWRKFTFAAITTSKIRVTVNAALNTRSRIVEVEAWRPAAGAGNTANINWLVADQLGTPRMIFDQTGSLATMKRHDYLPFGEELFAGQGARATQQRYVGDNVRQKFTSKERDNETGLDYFLARSYASSQGRFTSPDEPFADQSADNPQSWNLYSYVRNNPLIMVDPTGRFGDYYDRNGNWVFTDNIKDDKVYQVTQTTEPDGAISWTRQDLGITHTQFKIISNIVRHEGTSTDAQEYLWIAHTSNNEAAATNSSLYAVLQTRFSSVSNKTNGLATTNTSVQANASRAGVIDVLTGGADPTGGARRWDGTDFLAWGLNGPYGSHAKFREFATIDIPGAIYSTYASAQKAKWGNSVSYRGRGRYTLPAAVFTIPANWVNGNFHYVTGTRNKTRSLTATGAKGETIFWRF